LDKSRRSSTSRTPRGGPKSSGYGKLLPNTSRARSKPKVSLPKSLKMFNKGVNKKLKNFGKKTPKKAKYGPKTPKSGLKSNRSCIEPAIFAQDDDEISKPRAPATRPFNNKPYSKYEK
jgi:hypothetical protein